MIKKEILSDTREIVKVSVKGDIRYKVRYLTKTKISFMINDKCLFSFTHNSIDTSDILFKNKENAIAYGKLSYKADYKCNNDIQIYHTYMFPQFNSYGHFRYKDTRLFGQHRQMFYFKFNDEDKYGEAISFGDVDDFLNYSDKVIKELTEYIKEHTDDEIVEKYDVVTLKSIPFEKLNASSKELEELNKLLEQYRNDCKVYQDFLEKLLKQ